MKRMIFPIVVALVLAFGMSQAQAEETQNFMGKVPTPEELVEALSLPKESKVRTRGIRLNLSQKEKTKEVVAQAAPKPKKKAPRVALDIKFKYDSDQLTATAKQTLQSLGKALNSPELKGSTFILEGHTDSTGPKAYNMQLSERRARAAEKYLQTTCNVTNAKLIVKFYGESRPLVKNDPASSDNRRVEVVNVPE